MKVRKRLIALNIGVLLAVVFSIVYVFSVGNHYTLHTHTFLPFEEPPRTEIQLDHENIVEVEKIRMENGELVIDFSAVDKGETDVHIRYLFSEEAGMVEMPEHSFSVNFLGTIVDRTEGTFHFNGYIEVIIAILAVLLMTEFVMLWLFSDYRKSGGFSYPMIACGGIGVYTLIILLYIIYKLLNNAVDSFSYFLVLVSETGTMLLLALTPVMLLLSLLLAFSNIWLMRHEGYRPVNALGIVFGILWFAGSVLTLGAPELELLWDIPFYGTVSHVLGYVIAYFECMFLATVVSSFLAARYRPKYDRDYIIILGCAIRKDGSLTPLLKGRVDSAVAFEKQQYETTGKHAVFVPSGGQGADEVISEGEAMENYLLSIGIPAEQIAREDKSVNTFQNMQFSKQVIDRHAEGKDSKIAFATTNYHVFRGYILARKNGFDAKGVSAKTKPYFFPNAFLREFVGLLVDQKWRNLAFLLFVMLFSVVSRFF